MPNIISSKHLEIEKLYLSGQPILKIAKHFSVSPKVILSAMKKAGITRRNHKEARAIYFENKNPSFSLKRITSQNQKEIIMLGIALYWAEGYKTDKSKGVDFANSDPEMIVSFIKFLRTCYDLDESKFRIQLYAFSDQDISNLITFWSNLTQIPQSQFSKPYIKTNSSANRRKMQFGLVHIRYSDKKMLFDILERIQDLKRKSLGKQCVGGRVVNCI